VSNTEYPNGALSIAHLCILAPLSVFTGVATKLCVIVGEPPIEVLEGELVWLLNLPGQLMPKWHPQLLLCKLDDDDDDELCFVQMHGVGCLRIEIVVHIDERCGKWCWLDTLFGRVAWIQVTSAQHFALSNANQREHNHMSLITHPHDNSLRYSLRGAPCWSLAQGMTVLHNMVAQSHIQYLRKHQPSRSRE